MKAGPGNSTKDEGNSTHFNLAFIVGSIFCLKHSFACGSFLLKKTLVCGSNHHGRRDHKGKEKGILNIDKNQTKLPKNNQPCGWKKEIPPT